MLLRRQAEQVGAQERPALQVERPALHRAHEPPRSASAPLGQGREVDHRLRQRRPSLDLLHGAGRGGAEDRAQRLVAAQDLGEGGGEGGDVEPAATAAGRPPCCRPGSPAPGGRGTRAAPGRRRAAAGGRGGRGGRADRRRAGRRPRSAAPARSAPPARRRWGPRRSRAAAARPRRPRAGGRRAGWPAGSGRRGRRSCRRRRLPAVEAEQVGPEGGEPLLRRGARRRAGRPLRPPRRRQGPPVELAVGGERQGRQLDQEGRHHVVGEARAQRLAQLRGGDVAGEVGDQPWRSAGSVGSVGSHVTTACRAPARTSARSTSAGSTRKPRILSWRSARPANATSPSGR